MMDREEVLDALVDRCNELAEEITLNPAGLGDAQIHELKCEFATAYGAYLLLSEDEQGARPN
jgi:hypothetical protein